MVETYAIVYKSTISIITIRADEYQRKDGFFDFYLYEKDNSLIASYSEEDIALIRIQEDLVGKPSCGHDADIPCDVCDDKTTPTSVEGDNTVLLDTLSVQASKADITKSDMVRTVEAYFRGKAR